MTGWDAGVAAIGIVGVARDRQLPSRQQKTRLSAGFSQRVDSARESGGMGAPTKINQDAEIYQLSGS